MKGTRYEENYALQPSISQLMNQRDAIPSCEINVGDLLVVSLGKHIGLLQKLVCLCFSPPMVSSKTSLLQTFFNWLKTCLVECDPSLRVGQGFSFCWVALRTGNKSRGQIS